MSRKKTARWLCVMLYGLLAFFVVAAYGSVAALAAPWEPNLLTLTPVGGLKIENNQLVIDPTKIQEEPGGSGVVTVAFSDATLVNFDISTANSPNGTWNLTEEDGALPGGKALTTTGVEDEGEARLTWKAPVKGGKLTFSYRIDSEEDYDYLRLLKKTSEGEEELWKISGKVPAPNSQEEWAECQIDLPASNTPYQLVWVYTKDECGVGGADKAVLGGITLEGGTTVTSYYGQAIFKISYLEGNQAKTVHWLGLKITSAAIEPPASGAPARVEFKYVVNNDGTTVPSAAAFQPFQDGYRINPGMARGKYLWVQVKISSSSDNPADFAKLNALIVEANRLPEITCNWNPGAEWVNYFSISQVNITEPDDGSYTDIALDLSTSDDFANILTLTPLSLEQNTIAVNKDQLLTGKVVSGEYYWRLRAKDGYGDWGEPFAGKGKVKIDLTGPKLRLSSSYGTRLGDLKVILDDEGRAGVNGGKIKFNNGSELSITTGEEIGEKNIPQDITSGWKAGLNKIMVTATDKLGNVTSQELRFFYGWRLALPARQFYLPNPQQAREKWGNIPPLTLFVDMSEDGSGNKWEPVRLVAGESLTGDYRLQNGNAAVVGVDQDGALRVQGVGRSEITLDPVPGISAVCTLRVPNGMRARMEEQTTPVKAGDRIDIYTLGGIYLDTVEVPSFLDGTDFVWDGITSQGAQPYGKYVFRINGQDKEINAGLLRSLARIEKKPQISIQKSEGNVRLVVKSGLDEFGEILFVHVKLTKGNEVLWLPPQVLKPKGEVDFNFKEATEGETYTATVILLDLAGNLDLIEGLTGYPTITVGQPEPAEFAPTIY